MASRVARLSALGRQLARPQPGGEAWEVHRLAQARAPGPWPRPMVFLTYGVDASARPPAAAVAATCGALQRGGLTYAPSGGLRALREAVAARQARWEGRPVAPERVVVTSGAQMALYLSARVALEAGDEVVVPEPMYATYPATLAAAGATIVPVPLAPANNFALTGQMIADRVTPRTKAVVLTNPHNPTGRVWERGLIAAVSQLCKERGLFCISDEVYRDFVFDGREYFVPSQFLHEADNCVFSVGSLSKSHSLVAWRMGWVVAPDPDTAAVVQALGDSVHFGLPQANQEGAVAALGSAGFAEGMAARYRERRDAVVEGLRGVAGLEVLVPEAGMFCLVSAKGLGVSGADFAMRLLDFGVATLPVDDWGAAMDGLFRVAFVADVDVLRYACGQIAQCAAEIGREGGRGGGGRQAQS